jgi:nucleotide-binding universal stress UspA family protein
LIATSPTLIFAHILMLLAYNDGALDHGRSSHEIWRCLSLGGRDLMRSQGRHVVFKHLLIPTDGSELSERAIRYGVEFAKHIGARISFLTVTEPFHTISLKADQVEDTPDEYHKHAAQHATHILSKGAEYAQEAGVSHDTMHVEHDHPYQAIIQAAEAKGCDLVVMSSHGRRGLSAAMLGSQTVSVLTHSSVPVLVYRLPRDGAREQHAASETNAALEQAPIS